MSHTHQAPEGKPEVKGKFKGTELQQNQKTKF